MLDRSSYDCGQTPNECAPPHLRLWNSNKKKLKCNRLGNTEARNEFWHLIDEKLGEPEPCLSSENNMEQQWTYISSVLYGSDTPIVGYKSRNHQDWFDDNSDAIHNLLKDMHKALEKALEIQSFDNKNDKHNFYNAVKTIYGPTNHCINSMKTADWLTLLKDQNSILLSWADCQHHQDRSDLPMEYQCPTHTTCLHFWGWTAFSSAIF